MTAPRGRTGPYLAVDTYHLPSAPLRVEAPPDVAAVLAGRLADFRPAARPAPDAAPLRVRYASAPPTHDREGAVPAGSTAGVCRWRGAPFELWTHPAEGRLDMVHRGRSYLRARRREGVAEIALDPDYRAHLRLFTHMLFTIGVTELLLARGTLSLHAAAFETGGRALLFVGASGAGKSTLAMALLRARLGFMADDWVMLRREPAGLRLHAVPDEVDLLDGTVARFPELDLRAGRRYPGGAKIAVRPERLLPGVRLVRSAEPAVLVFPRVAHRPETELEPLPPSRALERLVPQLRLADPATMAWGLGLLHELTRRCRCYEMRTGTDLFDGDLVADRLRALAARPGVA